MTAETNQELPSTAMGFRLFRSISLISPAVAVWILVGVANILRICRGMDGVYSLVRSYPAPSQATAAVDGMAVKQAVTRATVFFPFSTQCLIRSAVTVALLRTRGVVAHLVIGCRQLPFAAHAWVEVDGRPFNEDEDVARLYVVIDRI